MSPVTYGERGVVVWPTENVHHTEPFRDQLVCSFATAISRIASHDSTPPSNPGKSTSSGRTANHVIATHSLLRSEFSGLSTKQRTAHIPMVCRVIGTVLRIARLIEVSTPLLTVGCRSWGVSKEMGDTHHTVNHLI